MEIATIVG